MPHVISIIQSKGGTGKTTSAMFLAAALERKGRKVVVIDMDPQLSAFQWAEQTADIRFPVVKATSERELNTWLSRTTEADYLIVDTPPGAGNLIDAAASIASLILVPTRATTRRAFGTNPELSEPWKALADELEQAFD